MSNSTASREVELTEDTKNSQPGDSARANLSSEFVQSQMETKLESSKNAVKEEPNELVMTDIHGKKSDVIDTDKQPEQKNDKMKPSEDELPTKTTEGKDKVQTKPEPAGGDKVQTKSEAMGGDDGHAAPEAGTDAGRQRMPRKGAEKDAQDKDDNGTGKKGNTSDKKGEGDDQGKTDEHLKKADWERMKEEMKRFLEEQKTEKDRKTNQEKLTQDLADMLEKVSKRNGGKAETSNTVDGTSGTTQQEKRKSSESPDAGTKPQSNDHVVEQPLKKIW